MSKSEAMMESFLEKRKSLLKFSSFILILSIINFSFTGKPINLYGFESVSLHHDPKAITLVLRIYALMILLYFYVVYLQYSFDVKNVIKENISNIWLQSIRDVLDSEGFSPDERLDRKDNKIFTFIKPIVKNKTNSNTFSYSILDEKHDDSSIRFLTCMSTKNFNTWNLLIRAIFRTFINSKYLLHIRFPGIFSSFTSLYFIYQTYSNYVR